MITLQKKLPTRQIHWKHSKSIDKLIIYKFTDEFLSPSVFMSLSVITDEFKINLLINPSIYLAIDDIRR